MEYANEERDANALGAREDAGGLDAGSPDSSTAEGDGASAPGTGNGALGVGEDDGGPLDAGAGERDARAAEAGATGAQGGDAGGGRAADAAAGAEGGAIRPPSAPPNGLDCASYRGLIACDDFNGSKSGTTVAVAGATLTRDGYLEVATGASASAAHVSFNGVTAGALYLRFSLYVPSGTSLVGLTVARLGALAVRSDFGVDLNLVRGGEVELSTSIGRIAGLDTYTIPRDRWICVLLNSETIDDRTGAAHAELDGARVVAATGLDTEPTGGISGAAAGSESVFTGQGAATLYVDNIVLASDPPGLCP